MSATSQRGAGELQWQEGTRTPNWSRVFYTAIQNHDPEAITACYAQKAYFEDIAFELPGRDRIHEMWRLVCHGEPAVTFNVSDIAADDRKGTGLWRAKYCFGKTATKPGRPVDNTLNSEFTFENNLIIDHRDRCDPMKWARQAIAPPLSFLVGSIKPLRQHLAKKRLESFLRDHN